jgi:8-oxo-dGTP diphosphatase
MFEYKYPHPALTADAVVFALDRESVDVLLGQRRNDPYRGQWAFPGGFAEEGETIEQTAARELKEETRLDGLDLRQFHTFSRPGRDPRGWTVSVGFLGCVNRNQMEAAEGGDDALQARWFPLDELPSLAFDHAEIFHLALAELKRLIHCEPLAFSLLNPIFTFDDADTLFSTLIGEDMDVFEWLSRMRKEGLVKVHNEDIPSYIFDRKAYSKRSADAEVRFL